jgi:hypothetical protein
MLDHRHLKNLAISGNLINASLGITYIAQTPTNAGRALPQALRVALLPNRDGIAASQSRDQPKHLEMER